MNFNRISFIILLSFMIVACNNSNGSQQNPISGTTEGGVDQAEKGTAQSILNFRIKESNELFPIIEADTWEYKFVFDGKEMSKEGAYNGQWIDFKDDNSYVYGNNDQVKGSGRYHFSIDNSILLMVDNDKDKKAQEYEAKFAGDVMVLVGTSTYKDNAFQMKLERIPDSTFPH